MTVSRDLTKNQQQVFDLLVAEKAPMSAYQLLDRLRDYGFRAPLQVYRALEKLIEYGKVHRLESMNSFVACAQPDCENHGLVAFAICEKCGQVNEFNDDKVAHDIHHHMHDMGFKAKTTTLEIRGLCKACQK